MRTEKLGPLTENPNFKRPDDFNIQSRSTPFGRERYTRACRAIDEGKTEGGQNTIDNVKFMASLTDGEVLKLTTLLNSTDDEKVLVAIAALKILGKRAVPILLKTLEVDPPELKRRKLDILAELGPEAKEAVPVLIHVLENDIPAHKELAAYALGGMGSAAQEAVVPLSRAAVDYRDIESGIPLEELDKSLEHTRGIARRAIPPIILGHSKPLTSTSKALESLGLARAILELIKKN